MNDLLIVVVLNHSKDAILLINHQNLIEQNAPSTDNGLKFFQYWFPFKQTAPPGSNLSTLKQIESLITVSKARSYFLVENCGEINLLFC
jgi:hypothetical protein